MPRGKNTTATLVPPYKFGGLVTKPEANSPAKSSTKLRNSDGVTRTTKSLVMGDKKVAGTGGPHAGPVYFREQRMKELRGFNQAKPPTAWLKGHADPTPHQECQPEYQRWKPREDV